MEEALLKESLKVESETIEKTGLVHVSQHSSWNRWHLADLSLNSAQVSTANSLDPWLLHGHIETLPPPHHGHQTLCILQSIYSRHPPIYIMGLTNPSWPSQCPSFTWRTEMRTALPVLPFKNLSLFPLEHNLGCSLSLCPRFQSLLCSYECFLFFITA